MKQRYYQLKEMAESRLSVVREIENGSVPENEKTFCSTYSSLKEEEKKSMQEGLEELANNPLSVGSMKKVPIKLIFIDPQMREMQTLINEILKADVENER